jgi:nitrite reductase (NADH) large subunit
MLTNTAEKQQTLPDPLEAEAEAPVIVVGTGPVGIHTAQELLRHNPKQPIVIFGAEPWTPYNRVKLSSLLAGDISTLEIHNELNVPATGRVWQHHNCAIVSIDRQYKTVTDSSGRIHTYDKLVLAVGSQAHVPNIPGTGLPGVYTFRDLNDAQKLMARRVRSRRTMVIGGGLLGLEAAKAMQKNNTEVFVVEHNSRLMQNQLDQAAAELLREHLLSLDIRIVLQDGIKQIHGDLSVNQIELRSGRIIPCDTVIIATGIKPNVDLARNCSLPVGRGIRVNQFLQTADANIYAAGECAEYNGNVYGIVAPGLEQAAIAAHHISGGTPLYKGSILATSLKIIDKPVFSMGIVDEGIDPSIHKQHVYRDISAGVYRKIVRHRSRIVGAVSIGPWSDTRRLQEIITYRRRIGFWHLYRFRKTGLLWSDDTSRDVHLWPSKAIVCNCKNVTRGQLSLAYQQGQHSLEQLANYTGASTICGSCKPLVAKLTGASADSAIVKGRTLLSTGALLTALAVLLFYFAPAIPDAQSVQDFRIDILWNDSFWKQVSGYTILGLSTIALLLSLRKRWHKVSFGDFAWWRATHVLLGTLILVALFLHTGLHLGAKANFVLLSFFLTLAFTGALAAGTCVFEPKLNPHTAKQLRNVTQWLHLLLFWPLPVLLGFHILSFYYF